jgi:hypothetical protein
MSVGDNWYYRRCRGCGEVYSLTESHNCNETHSIVPQPIIIPFTPMSQLSGYSVEELVSALIERGFKVTLEKKNE